MMVEVGQPPGLSGDDESWHVARACGVIMEVVLLPGPI